jgi:hypothetical protein
MHYSNTKKKKFLNHPARLVMLVAVMVCAVLILSTNSSQKVYATAFPTPANFNWGWDWDGGINAINLTVTSKQFCGATNNQCAKVVFDYHQASNTLNDFTSYYYVSSCTPTKGHTCQTDVYSPFVCQGQNPTLEITGGPQLTENMTLNLSYPNVNALQCLDTSYGISVLGGGSLVGDTTWFNTAGTPKSAASEASLLEFLSPTEIYDTGTKTLYKTYNDPYNDNQFAKGGTQFFNNGDTVYWPAKDLSTGKNIDSTVPIPSSTNNNCAGGIVVSTDPGYPTIYLLPAGSIGSASTGGIGCFFGTSGINLHSIANSTDFYSSSVNTLPLTTPMSQLLEIASYKMNGVANIKMFYAMFYWAYSNSIISINNFDDGGISTLSNLEQTNKTLYTQTLADLPGINSSSGNYQIFTSSACTGAAFPLILVNYSDTKGLTDFDFSSSNVTATFYYGGLNSFGHPTNKWVSGWSSNLQCLFGITLPQYNPTSNNLTQTSAFTYIAYPSVSICTASCSSSLLGGGGSSSIDTCYDPNTGWTYECGSGATPSQNQHSSDLVTDHNYKSDPTANKLYDFSASGGCYLAELIPEQPLGSPNVANSYKMAWVEQPATDCSSQPYFNISSAQADGLQVLPPLSQQSTSSSTGSATVPNPNGCNPKTGSNNCLVTGYINPLIKFLNVAVSLVVVISVVMGGIQYSTSKDNPEAVKAARKRIFNALIGFAAYFLLYAFLNFIIPGGI